MQRLREVWTSMASHPRGRWVRLGLETLWYLALILAIGYHWGAPQAFFSYMGM